MTAVLLFGFDLRRRCALIVSAALRVGQKRRQAAALQKLLAGRFENRFKHSRTTLRRSSI
jgi:hypothetical protein